LGKRIRHFDYGDLEGEAKEKIDRAASHRPRPQWHRDGWRPFRCTSAEARTNGLVVQGILLDAGGLKSPLTQFCQTGLRCQFRVTIGPVSIGYDLITHGAKAADYFNEEVVFARCVIDTTWEFSAISVDEQGEVAVFYTRLDRVTLTT
jgi:hypothetical protein